MRPSKWSVLLGVALLLELGWCAPADACRRHRCGRSCVADQACNSCCSPNVPCWARCIDLGSLRGDALRQKCSELGLVCWCYNKGVWTPFQGANEVEGIKYCFAPGFNPQEKGIPGPQAKAAAPSAAPDTRRCAMVCDCCTHTWRFAYPWETPLAMLSLDYLGTHCNPPHVMAAPK